METEGARKCVSTFVCFPAFATAEVVRAIDPHQTRAGTSQPELSGVSRPLGETNTATDYFLSLFLLLKDNICSSPPAAKCCVTLPRILTAVTDDHEVNRLKKFSARCWFLSRCQSSEPSSPRWKKLQDRSQTAHRPANAYCSFY
ncbi:unnamed protein product [Pleuronectes platessa]|uniref:Uncharacterized protein n=1 Tax=Pleuronectes platessa TaxID=8262 RepID=A0A9N7VIJ6_PLEPL|nr:unnamed protein product [Pleuronectes platessa]